MKEKSIKAESYQIMKNGLEDKLLDVKLAFFGYVVRILEPFLKEFQTENPMAPLLFSSIKGIIVDLIRIFVKKEVSRESIEIKANLNCQENLKVAENIDFHESFLVNTKLKKMKTASEKEILIFKNDTMIFLKSTWKDSVFPGNSVDIPIYSDNNCLRNFYRNTFLKNCYRNSVVVS